MPYEASRRAGFANQTQRNALLDSSARRGPFLPGFLAAKGLMGFGHRHTDADHKNSSLHLDANVSVCGPIDGTEVSRSNCNPHPCETVEHGIGRQFGRDPHIDLI